MTRQPLLRSFATAARPPRGRRDILDLRGATITHSDLSGFDLRGVDLTGSDLTHSNVTGADLRGTRLDRAVLQDTDLTDTALNGSRAAKTTFTRAVARG